MSHAKQSLDQFFYHTLRKAQLAEKAQEKVILKTTARCKHCTHVFTVKREWQSYCSDACRARAFSAEKEVQVNRDKKRLEYLEEENEKLRAEVERLKIEVMGRS